MTIFDNDRDSKKTLNLETIAEKAGVSRSTVSRVINNHPNVSPKTRNRVMAVIQEERYTPNPAARMLVTRRTNVIGVVIPLMSAVVLNDAYHFRLLQGIAKVTARRNYAMLLWLQDPSTHEQHFYENIRSNRMMDGVFISPATTDSYIINQLVKDQIPYVTVERNDRPSPVGYVTVDNVAASQTAVEHLLSLGRRRIGIVTGPSNNVDSVDRLTGYCQALERFNVPYNPELVYEGDFSRGSGHNGAKYLLIRSADAIFATNDYVALGVLDALAEADLVLPRDVAVIGFDDLPFAAQITPKLTTTFQPIQEKAERATDLLIDYIEGKNTEPQKIILPTQFIVRESCSVVAV